MEIERKFLIKEKEKIYPCPINVDDLKKDIKKYGQKITQHYLPIEAIDIAEEELNFKIKFIPNEIRLRKINNKYFITIKSKGSQKRSEFEKRITKEIYKKYEIFSIKKLEKIRLEKKINEKTFEFDYYPKYSLITAEIEFNNIKELNSFKTNMKEITGVDKYKNRKLAE